MPPILNPREREVFTARYLYGMPLEAIGRQFDVTRERIRQIIEKTLPVLDQRMNLPKQSQLVREWLLVYRRSIGYPQEMA